MDRYFAQINNGIVQRVIAAHTKEWCEQNLGGVWVETFIDNPDKNYAGSGHSYDEVSDNFVAPKPFDSWVLDEKQKWTSPVPLPKDMTNKGWSEKEMKWKDIETVKQEVLLTKTVWQQ